VQAPRVQIVSRDDEAEYVECQECGDVFESSELKDMAIEEKKEPTKSKPHRTVFHPLLCGPWIDFQPLCCFPGTETG